VNRRLLVLGTGILFSIGAIVFGWILAASWKMNDGAKARHLSVDISGLGRGTVKVLDRPNERIFIVRTKSDAVIAVAAPAWGGSVFLPVPNRSHFEGPCYRFEPEQTGGVLNDDSAFRCVDAEPGAGYLYAVRWTLDGRRIDNRLDENEDLLRLRFERSGNFITLPRPQ
jgi:hypothetical protein